MLLRPRDADSSTTAFGHGLRYRGDLEPGVRRNRTLLLPVCEIVAFVRQRLPSSAETKIAPLTRLGSARDTTTTLIGAGRYVGASPCRADSGVTRTAQVTVLEAEAKVPVSQVLGQSGPVVSVMVEESILFTIRIGHVSTRVSVVPAVSR